MMLFIAGMVVLALFVPAAMAADYPQNGQFIAQYDENQLVKDTSSSKNAGTTIYNSAAAEKASALVSATRTYVNPVNPGEDWPLFMHDAANTGFSPCDGVPQSSPTVTVFDEYEVPGAINPVIAGGYIILYTGYSGFDEGSISEINLTCLYEDNLTVKWDYALPRTIAYGSWASAATDGVYAYGVSDDEVVCVEIASGSEVWTYYTVGSVICNGGPTIGGDYLFCSDWSGHYYCLDRYTGNEEWVFDDTDSTYDMEYTQGTPAYDSADGAIYVTSYGYSGGSTGQLFKVDSSGNEVWSAQVSGSCFCGSPSIDDDFVYVTSYNFGGEGGLFKFNKTNGNLEDSVAIERTDATPAIDEENGLIYVSGGCYGYADPETRCYNISDFSDLKWENTIVGGWTCSVTLADGLAFVGRETGYPTYCYDRIYVFDAITGAPKWYNAGGGSTAAIANDKVYSVGNDGAMYVFS